MSTRRRSVLALLGALAASRPWPDAHAGAAAAVAGVIAWGAQGAWLALPGGRVQHWPDAVLPPQPAPGGVWLAGRDGRVQRWQVDAGGDEARPIARFEAGMSPHAMAVADEGRWLFVAAGEQLIALDGEAQPQRRWQGRDLQRRHRGAAQALFAHAGRRSLVAAWPALGELWEIALDPAAPPHFDGLVHDWRLGEGLPVPGFLAARRSPLGRPMADVAFADARLPWLAGTRGDDVDILHLDVRRRIASLTIPGARVDAALWRPAPADDAQDGRWWLPAGDALLEIDARRWRVTGRARLPGAIRQLQALRGEVRAWVEAPQPLWRTDAGAAAWQPVPLPPGRITAFAADTLGGHWLLATADAAALHRIDADGRSSMRWNLPDEVSVQVITGWHAG